MSPRKLRRPQSNRMDQSNTSRSSRSRTRHSITSDKKNLSINETDLEDQKKDQTTILLLNDSQQKHTKTQSIRLLKKEMSNKNEMTRNHKLKVNKNDVHNNSSNHIDDISNELFKESPTQFKGTCVLYNKMKPLKKSPYNFDINSEEDNECNNSLNGTITPKCSPISVTLTPLRTTKTPKRSPVNLASPKVHSEVAFKLSKTPRKLQLFSNFPTKSSGLDKSLRNRKNISNEVHNSTLGNNSLNDIDTKSSELRKSRTSTEKLKPKIRRLSKMPKTGLTLSTLKSELRAQKIKLDSQNNGNISLDKPRSLKKNISRKVSLFSNKNDNDKSLPSKESQLELTLTNINDLSGESKEIISKKPIVLLERIPLLDTLCVSLKTQSNRHLMDTTLDVIKHIQKQLFQNLYPLKQSVAHINHKYPMKTEETILSRSFNNRRSTELNNTSTIVSSTPISRRSSNTSSVTPVLLTDERVKRNILKKDDEKNSTYDMNKTSDKQNNTMVIENEEVAVADETYDLFEPKTPRLKQRFRRSATVEIDDDTKEIKKVAKVRFTTPESLIEKVQSNSNVAVRKTPRVKYISRRRSNSLSNIPAKISTPNLVCKRICMSISNNNRTPCKSSNKKENTTSSTNNQIKFNTKNEEKKEIKPQSVKKKVPNFVEIHKQMFAKMESVVDNKKRLKQQHEALITKTPKVLRLDQKKIKKFRSTETKDETFNRYGFKLKKADAINIVLKKQHTDVQKKKREENKAFLNGVRTNRRFELLMKMRKMSN